MAFRRRERSPDEESDSSDSSDGSDEKDAAPARAPTKLTGSKPTATTGLTVAAHLTPSSEVQATTG